MGNKRILGIIGMGPRGLYALENLIFELHRTDELSNVHLLLFEETGNFGNGHIYDINQTETNWINISERILSLNKRKAIDCQEVQISSFPSYQEWTGKERTTKHQADAYPPRAYVGEYLSERFQTFVEPLLEIGMVSLHKKRVVNIDLVQNKVSIQTDKDNYGDVDEILLTIGHQPTELSEQILKWEKFSKTNERVTLFKSCYPIQNLLTCEQLTEKSVIGIRGFGLATIDVVRGIALKFGEFITDEEATKSVIYQSEYRLQNLFVPFSLNGLPVAPKPLNAAIDEWFEPTTEQISAFEQIIENADNQKRASSPHFIIAAIAPIAARVYLSLSKSDADVKLSVEEIEKIVVNWLKDDQYEHSLIISQKLSAEKIMQVFVKMATGTGPVSLDYCIGQVWRHCQPSIYDKLSYNECSEKVFSEIIKLDEGMKRYAYGPPVESIQQMLALISAGVMTLDVVNDPEIDLTDKGWHLKRGEKTITADMMVNSVLDSPKIKSVKSSLVKSLLINDLIEPVYDDLGIKTAENGLVTCKNKEVPIALLGRLAKGTIIGVDAILECFGDRPQMWASAAANRHKNCAIIKM